MILFSSLANFEKVMKNILGGRKGFVLILSIWKLFWILFDFFLNKRKESLERKSCCKLKTQNASFWKWWNVQVLVSPSWLESLTQLSSHRSKMRIVSNTLQQKGPWTSSCEVTVSWGQSASPGRHTGPDLQRDLGTKRYREVQSGIYKSTWAR